MPDQPTLPTFCNYGKYRLIRVLISYSLQMGQTLIFWMLYSSVEQEPLKSTQIFVTICTRWTKEQVLGSATENEIVLHKIPKEISDIFQIAEHIQPCWNISGISWNHYFFAPNTCSASLDSKRFNFFSE